MSRRAKALSSGRELCLFALANPSHGWVYSMHVLCVWGGEDCYSGMLLTRWSLD